MAVMLRVVQGLHIDKDAIESGEMRAPRKSCTYEPKIVSFNQLCFDFSDKDSLIPA